MEWKTSEIKETPDFLGSQISQVNDDGLDEKTVVIEEPDKNLSTPGEQISKKWGIEKYIANEEFYISKLLIIQPGSSTSMHFHKDRKEHLYILSGEYIIVTLDLLKSPGKKTETMLGAGDLYIAEPLEFHQIKCIRPGQILEVSDFDDKSDVYRIEDAQ